MYLSRSNIHTTDYMTAYCELYEHWYVTAMLLITWLLTMRCMSTGTLHQCYWLHDYLLWYVRALVHYSNITDHMTTYYELYEHWYITSMLLITWLLTMNNTITCTNTNTNTNTNTFISGKNPYTIGTYIRTSKSPVKDPICFF